MSRLALIALVAAVSATASAQKPDEPYRPWGKVLVLDMAFGDAQACIARQLATVGSVLVLPVDGGADIDFALKSGLFATPGEPYVRALLRQGEGGAVTLTFRYRHPMRQSTPDGLVKSLKARCLVVKSEAPEPGV